MRHHIVLHPISQAYGLNSPAAKRSGQKTLDNPTALAYEHMRISCGLPFYKHISFSGGICRPELKNYLNL
jgi:hypothetical protein